MPQPIISAPFGGASPLAASGPRIRQDDSKLLDPAALPLDIFAGRLAGFAGEGPSYRACCPAHIDSTPSLSLTELADGKVLLHCHAGCDIDSILSAVGLRRQHLFPSAYAAAFGRRDRPVATAGRLLSNAEPTADPRFGQIMAEYRRSGRDALRPWADRLGLPVDALDLIGAAATGNRLATPEYDADGRVVGVMYRSDDGRKRSEPGGHRGLTLPQIQPPGDIIYLAEGQSDTATFLALGLPAIGRPGAMPAHHAVRWIIQYLQRQPVNLVVVGDRDEHGQGQLAARYLADLLAHTLPGRVVIAALPSGFHKDVRSQFNAGDIRLGLNYSRGGS